MSCLNSLPSAEASIIAAVRQQAEQIVKQQAAAAAR